MKLFGINFSSSSDFKITEDDKVWVEENFRWLKQVFGYPNKDHEQILLTAKFFPATFQSQAVSVENAMSDLCQLLTLPRKSVHYVVLSDIRDLNNVPYQIEGKPFECETELRKGDHTIYIANSLLKHPDRLLFCLIYEFIRIRLTESDLEFDTGGDDTSLFIYLAGIYYGFGVLLAQNLLHAGRSTDGRWEIKWHYGSEMPQQVMAFSLATYAHMRGERNPEWKNEFKGDFRHTLDGALDYVNAHPTDLYDEAEIKANALFSQSCDHFDKNEFDEAIGTLQKILFLTKDDHMKADVFNNMGYYYMRRNDFQQAISNFRKALTFGPAYGYANDNLGYALVMTGELEEGYRYLEKAQLTENNDPAYTFRNFALYYQHKGDFALAEEHFQKAFAENTPVDLLEFHYGEFLEQRGDHDTALQFFQKSAAKNEDEGKKKLARST
ncbi:MAG TPA: tetratricopeptide repeat protein [Chryseosolibacter sp.]